MPPNEKYRHLTDRFTYFAAKVALAVVMVVEVSREYLSTFNRQIGQQLYNEIRRDYASPRGVCRSLSELFKSHLDLHFGGERAGGNRNN